VIIIAAFLAFFLILRRKKQLRREQEAAAAKAAEAGTGTGGLSPGQQHASASPMTHQGRESGYYETKSLYPSGVESQYSPGYSAGGYPHQEPEGYASGGQYGVQQFNPVEIGGKEIPDPTLARMPSEVQEVSGSPVEPRR
jgi:hypothetical protein